MEQYSAAIHSASSTSSAGSVVGQDPQRVGQLVLGLVRQRRHHGVQALAAERHLEDRPDLHPVRAAVVERPAQDAGRREGLDLDDRGHCGRG